KNSRREWVKLKKTVYLKESKIKTMEYIIILAVIAFFVYHYYENHGRRKPEPKAPAVIQPQTIITQQEKDNLERNRLNELLNAPFDPAPEGAEPFFVVFDLETTGLPPDDIKEQEFQQWPVPVQIAWAVFTYEGEII